MTIEPITNAVDQSKADTAAAMDGHKVPAITHAVMSGNEIIGAFSTTYAPVLFFWMRHDQTGMASFRAICHARQAIRDLGHSRMILPIEPSSPYYGYMQGLGLDNLGQGELFIGEI